MLTGPLSLGFYPVRHRREHLRPLRRRGTDRGQHRRTHSHPRHPRPLRKAWRVGAIALPARPARPARVTSPRPRRRGRSPKDDTMRPRSRRAALGPLSGISGNWPRTARLRGPATPKSHARNPDPRLSSTQAGPCATAAYPADCPKRAFELPIPDTNPHRQLADRKLADAVDALRIEDVVMAAHLVQDAFALALGQRDIGLVTQAS